MSELDELYQQLILDHYRRPRNRRTLPQADRMAEGYNPLCGDHVTVFLKMDSDLVKEVTFEGSGCAISTASASLMTETLKGKTLAEARAIFRRFHGLVTGQPQEPLGGPGPVGGPGLGKLEVFSGVRKYPARVKCATLAWHTLDAALENRGEVVSTESDEL
ncbi:MAG: SUF system NifU family Fe-S cluster assembly protein [Phycisphaerae bacterium]|jgi:nitrogen fixation NifU-like protein|nr:SUF system NifU family Fe-S cluster assembly protein [Phycisphaerae bacterium]HOO17463.1 SUF system NifU family Fe-S cluster assembly protein [Phycisphaerae bacterium]HPC22656.1 SUF system NifU family Fe-S cluster assembly protein [Phycisphaerae bacterium]HRS27010.1 SUF system NifU family Fe-S cluster assembly protein [Phycisphaerae bacterium]HRT40795.1 SUF system NifU family Fe-S cluster assembly protein [Phycisphaerae bacterium]